jgi:hypothetical protein
MELSLEDIVTALDKLTIRANTRMESSGRYCPDIATIYYNPYVLVDRGEFYVTILHELLHHYYDDAPEDLVELNAQRIFKEEKESVGYLKGHFMKITNRWFK